MGLLGLIRFRQLREYAALRPSHRITRRVRQLRECGWEWTCTPFAPLPGFQAMPEYSEYSTGAFDRDAHMKSVRPAKRIPSTCLVMANPAEAATCSHMQWRRQSGLLHMHMQSRIDVPVVACCFLTKTNHVVAQTSLTASTSCCGAPRR